MKKRQTGRSEPLWYKDAVIYELHVKSFCDSNGDGTGDFKGLLSKLPYLHSLGVTALWLLPFYPSPLRDDGYDISDYCAINPDYGTMDDFRLFLKKAHELGIRVITELVVNHTSDRHPWFQRARTAPAGSSERNFYVWSDTQEKYRDARVIFKDFETSNWAYDTQAGAYYWHRFYHHQPDLNYENPAVQKEILRVVDFWLGLGVDGLRLDAVPYLYEEEGTPCENLPKTHEFLKKLRAHVDKKYRGRMLLCEANQWPEDAAAYFGSGDECHMAFHFPVMPRLFMSLWMEDNFPVSDILAQTPAIPDSCQWAVFLRNHDELTLEMVTDEERDYMYRVYARDAKTRINTGIRRRLAPLLGNNRRKIEMMNILLFSLPGTPVLYYGDEIGMGDNFYLGDRNGVRTPMQWSPDRNAGFSKANPQKLFLPVVTDPEYHYESVNVESQEGNLSSLLWWMRRVAAMRANFKAFGRGTLEAVQTDNPKVLAFIRRHEDEIMLVAVNLSRFSQAVGLDLSRYAGYVPVEVFSGSDFPAIREQPYLLTPGFHGYYWFLLKKQDDPSARDGASAAEAALDIPWDELQEPEEARPLEPALAAYVKKCGTFRQDASGLRSVRVKELLPLRSGVKMAVLEASYAQGWLETYALPLAFIAGDKALETAAKYPQAAIAQAQFADERGLLADAAWLPSFQADALSLFTSKQKPDRAAGKVHVLPSQELASALAANPVPSESRVLRASTGGVTIAYGTQYLLHLYRRLDEGVSQDIEISQRLSGQGGFPYAPAFYGSVNFQSGGRSYGTLGILRGFVPNQGDAWAMMTDEVSKFYDSAQAAPEAPDPAAPPCELRAMDLKSVPQQVVNLTGAVALEMAVTLGRRTAEMHRALAAPHPADPAFSTEPFSKLHQRSLYQSMSGHARKTLLRFSKKLRELPQDARENTLFLLENQQKIFRLMQKLTEKKFSGRKMRIHGNYILEQALFTGKEFAIKDFDGDLNKPPEERRIKRSPLRDVAEMLLSIYYSAYAPFLFTGRRPRKELETFSRWTDLWYVHVSGAFLKGYLDLMRDTQLIPQPDEDFYQLLRIYLADGALSKLESEALLRPDWTVVPASFLRRLMESSRECKKPESRP